MALAETRSTTSHAPLSKRRYLRCWEGGPGLASQGINAWTAAKRRAASVALLCIALTSCSGTATNPQVPAPPTTLTAIDQKIAVGLADAASIIQGLEPLVTKYPGLKDPLNRAIAAYTALKAAAKTFDDAVTSGANPDPAKIQADMQALLTSVNGLKATYP